MLHTSRAKPGSVRLKISGENSKRASASQPSTAHAIRSAASRMRRSSASRSSPITVLRHRGAVAVYRCTTTRRRPDIDSIVRSINSARAGVDTTTVTPCSGYDGITLPRCRFTRAPWPVAGRAACAMTCSGEVTVNPPWSQRRRSLIVRQPEISDPADAPQLRAGQPTDRPTTTPTRPGEQAAHRTSGRPAAASIPARPSSAPSVMPARWRLRSTTP